MKLVSVKDKFELDAYHAPAKGARKGGVVVVQEIFGVTEHIRTMANRFAEAGYEAIAPSMYDRAERGFEIKGPPDQAAIQKGFGYVQKTPWDQVAGDVQAAVDQLKDKGPVFVTGFCWGGTTAWLAACRCTGLSGASCFYGGMIAQLLGEKPKCPVIMHFGEKDASIGPDVRNKIKAAVGESVPFYVYDAGHGFCRAGSNDFNQAACDLAFQRSIDFFAANAK
ncbi:MAG TPA: dienelactone hydrolase family protein [Caulobacterales bacterium]|nr:dienelactone hydrolase family protein [Caulobacterales bacterium]